MGNFFANHSPGLFLLYSTPVLLAGFFILLYRVYRKDAKERYERWGELPLKDENGE